VQLAVVAVLSRMLNIALAEQLILDDGSKTRVAHSHPQSLGIVGKAHKAYIEIYPDGEDIIDIILMTFVYLEQQRRS
jgi:hypothetical protein